MSSLGALDPTAAASQVTTHGVTSSGRASILLAAQLEMLVDNSGNPAYIPGTAECAASGISGAARDLALAGTAGQLALQGAVYGGLVAAGPLTFGITIAIVGIVGLFSTIWSHHAQAVKKEQNVLCTAVPAANNYLKIIEQGVQTGLATPQQGIDALSSLLSDFSNSVSSIAHECNAACVMTEQLHAVVLVKSSRYQDLISAQSSATSPAPAVPSQPVVQPTRPNTVAMPAAAVPDTGSALSVAPSTTGDWLAIAAAAAAGFFLVRIL